MCSVSSVFRLLRSSQSTAGPVTWASVPPGPSRKPAQLARLKAPVLELFGGKDTGIPLDSVRAMEAAIKRSGRSVTIPVYAKANLK